VKERNACKLLAVKKMVKLGKPGHRWECNITIDVEKLELEGGGSCGMDSSSSR
jgi:hypothetical protein